MFAASQLWNHAAVARMHRNLRGHDRGKRARAALHHRGSGFVARAFNAEDQAAGHVMSLTVASLAAALVWSRMDVDRAFEAALKIVAELRASGYEAYLAGGCVRDLLLGREPVDYDVATSATPDIVLC